MDSALVKTVKNYTEWVRCNACWMKIDEKEPNFHLTQCGHVYCSRCIVSGQKRCFQCGEMNVISLPVSEPLNPRIAHYFTDPEILQHRIEQANTFQKSQMDLIMQRANSVESKYQDLKQEYMANVKQMKEIFIKYNKLKAAFLGMQKNKGISKNIVRAPGDQYLTPPNLTNGSQKSKEGFVVPTVTRVPKSAGYYSASSNGSNFSNCQDMTPRSTFSRYS